MKVTAIKILLMAQDMGRAIRFYRNVFGLKSKITGELWSELAWGGCIVGLHGGHDGSENRVSMSIKVDEIQDAAAQVQINGGHMVVSPHQRDDEQIIYSEFADTEGNIVMMSQYTGE